MILDKYKYLLFDLDDTLLDFGKAQVLAFKKLLEDENIEYNGELFEKYETINKSLWRSFERGEISNKEVTSERFIRFFSLFDRKVDGSEVDLNKYFEKIFISEEIGSKKPDREFFNIIFKEIGVENRDEVLMIGDTLTSDILGANKAGIDSCLVDIHKIYNPEIVPTYKIEKTIDLLEL